MNKLNIKKAIAVMERVEADGKSLDMHCWQRENDDHAYFEAKTTYEEFENDCGTVCCFAGWVAVSPEFQEDGGWADKNSGRPELVIKEYPDKSKDIVNAQAAIQHWLEIDQSQASALCGMSGSTEAYPHILPRCDVEDIGIGHVLKALHSLHDTGKLPGE